MKNIYIISIYIIYIYLGNISNIYNCEVDHSQDVNMPPIKLRGECLNCVRPFNFHPKTFMVHGSGLKLIEKRLKDIGLRRVWNYNEADVIWTFSYKFGDYASLRINQSYNHWLYNGNIAGKVLLWNNVKRYLKIFPNEYKDLTPSSYQLPRDWRELKRKVSSKNDNENAPSWILKGTAHRNINLIKNSDLRKLDKPDDIIEKKQFVQEYIGAHLIDGYKYDMGFYIVITSIKPLRIYIYEDDILVRSCYAKYPTSMEGFEKDKFSYVITDHYKALWTLNSLLNVYNGNNRDTMIRYWASLGKTNMIEEIYDKIIKAVIAGVDRMLLNVGRRTNKHAGKLYEMFRVDILVDNDLVPWVSEINMSPSMVAKNQVDEVMKTKIVDSVLELVGLSTEYKDDADPKVLLDKIYNKLEKTCASEQCDTNCGGKCSLCEHCQTTKERKNFIDLLLEIHRTDNKFKNIYPPRDPKYLEFARTDRNDLIGHEFKKLPWWDTLFKPEDLSFTVRKGHDPSVLISNEFGGPDNSVNNNNNNNNYSSDGNSSSTTLKYILIVVVIVVGVFLYKSGATSDDSRRRRNIVKHL